MHMSGLVIKIPYSKEQELNNISANFSVTAIISHISIVTTIICLTSKVYYNVNKCTISELLKKNRTDVLVVCCGTKIASAGIGAIG